MRPDENKLGRENELLQADISEMIVEELNEHYAGAFAQTFDNVKDAA